MYKSAALAFVSQKQLLFSVILGGKHKVIHLLARTEAEKEKWVQGLTYLVHRDRFIEEQKEHEKYPFFDICLANHIVEQCMIFFHFVSAAFLLQIIDNCYTSTFSLGINGDCILGNDKLVYRSIESVVTDIWDPTGFCKL